MIEHPSARLILLDPADRLFLFNVHDPGVFDPANPHSDPFWVMIGGFVDPGEEFADAAVREAREETGLDVRLEELIDIYSYPGHVPVIIVFAAAPIGGCLACDDEGLEARFFEPHEIPWEELAFRSTREALERFLGVSVPGGSEGPPLHSQK